MAENFESIEAYKQHKIEKHNEMLQKQRVPYSIKTDDGILIETEGDI